MQRQRESCVAWDGRRCKRLISMICVCRFLMDSALAFLPLTFSGYLRSATRSLTVNANPRECLQPTNSSLTSRPCRL